MNEIKVYVCSSPNHQVGVQHMCMQSISRLLLAMRARHPVQVGMQTWGQASYLKPLKRDVSSPKVRVEVDCL